jgi:hypothetical protein
MNVIETPTIVTKELSGKEAKKARRAEKTLQRAGQDGILMNGNANDSTGIVVPPTNTNTTSSSTTSVISTGASTIVRNQRPSGHTQQQQQQQQQKGSGRDGSSFLSSSSSSSSSSEDITKALATERAAIKIAWHSYLPRIGSNTAVSPTLLHAVFRSESVLGVFSSPFSGATDKAYALLNASKAFAIAFTPAQGTSFSRELYKSLQIQFNLLQIAVTGVTGVTGVTTSTTLAATNFLYTFRSSYYKSYSFFCNSFKPSIRC